MPYLHGLGITHLYASPLLKARHGSTHGYDVANPLALNPELGSDGEFEALVGELARAGMGLLLDIVPNHMAACPENPWWMDVLEHGPGSLYASYFDIEWDSPPAGRAARGKVLLPILDRPLRKAVQAGLVALALAESGFVVDCRGVRVPIDPKSYDLVLAQCLEVLGAAPGGDGVARQELAGILRMVEELPPRRATRAEEARRRHYATAVIKKRLWTLYSGDREARRCLDDTVGVFNGQRERAGTASSMLKLLSQQAYRLEYWRAGISKMNYRRFFDISDLVGVRVEDPRVFEETHSLVLRLVKAGKVHGLRVDHIDGLHDPLGYMERLRSHTAGETQTASSGVYTVVEKVLSGDERLPDAWPVSGTTGYDFLNAVNRLFVVPAGLDGVGVTYRRFTGSQASFGDIVYESKKRVIERVFPGELSRLGHRLHLLAQRDPMGRGLGLNSLLEALTEVTACCPVYRTYTRDFHVSRADRLRIDHAVEEGRRRNRGTDMLGLEFVRRVLLLGIPPSLPARDRAAWLEFVMRWQQFTGPVMAKGVEDTALYVYNRLISLNEVGGDAEPADVSVDAFHRRNQEALRSWPHSLSATSTHDTKRGEDVRARIAVLSEMPATWARKVNRWARWNDAKKRVVDGERVPDRNEEIHIYQTLIGACPLSDSEVAGFGKRLKAYVIKAAREAKVHTSWLDPDTAYERALVAFVDAILDGRGAGGFLQDFLPFQRRVAFYGMLNSLTQVVLKVASPGVPDFYQGTELWDLNLVDPDNRRPVDYAERGRILDELARCQHEERAAIVRNLTGCWRDGRVKLFVTWRALSFRRDRVNLFLEGDYMPIPVNGPRAEHVVAFARRRGQAWALVVVPRFLSRLVRVGEMPLGSQVWGEGCVLLPEDAPQHWVNVFTGDEVGSGTMPGEMRLSELFGTLPVALLTNVS